MHHFHPDSALAHPYDAPPAAENRADAPLLTKDGQTAAAILSTTAATLTTTTSPSPPPAEMSKGGTVEAAAFCVSESSTSSASSSSGSSRSHSNIEGDANDEEHRHSSVSSLHDLAFDDDSDDEATMQTAKGRAGAATDPLARSGATSRPALHAARLACVKSQEWWRAPCTVPPSNPVTGAATSSPSAAVQGATVTRASSELVYDRSYFFAPKASSSEGAGGRQVAPMAQTAAPESRSRTPAAPPRRAAEAGASRPPSRQQSPLPPRPHTPAASGGAAGSPGGARVTAARGGFALPSPLRSADLRTTSPAATPVAAGRLYSIGHAARYDMTGGSGTAAHPYLINDMPTTAGHRPAADSPTPTRHNAAVTTGSTTSGFSYSTTFVGPDRVPPLCSNSPLPPRAPSEEQRAALHAGMAAVWVDAPLSPAALLAAPLNDSLNSSGSHRRRTTPRPNSEPPSPALSTLAASFSSGALERAQSQGSFVPARRGRSVSLGAVPVAAPAAADAATTSLRACADCHNSAATSPTRTPPGSVFLFHSRSRVDVAPRPATQPVGRRRSSNSSGSNRGDVSRGGPEPVGPGHLPSPPPPNAASDPRDDAAGRSVEACRTPGVNGSVMTGQAMRSTSRGVTSAPPTSETDSSLARAMTAALQEYYTQTALEVRQLRREMKELKRAYLHASPALVSPHDAPPRRVGQGAITPTKNASLPFSSSHALVPTPSDSSNSSPLSSVSSSDADEAAVEHLLSPAVQHHSAAIVGNAGGLSEHATQSAGTGNEAVHDTTPPTARPLLPTMDETTVQRLMQAIERARQRALDTLGAVPSPTATTKATDAKE